VYLSDVNVTSCDCAHVRLGHNTHCCVVVLKAGLGLKLELLLAGLELGFGLNVLVLGLGFEDNELGLRKFHEQVLFQVHFLVSIQCCRLVRIVDMNSDSDSAYVLYYCNTVGSIWWD